MFELSINNVYTEHGETNRMITKIKKWGNSHGVTLSKDIMEKCELSANDKVKITTNGHRIIIEKETETITFDSLFKDWKNGEYKGGEFDWNSDDPIGKEVW